METAVKTAPMHTGRKVERIREILGIKQETLAKQLGVTQQAISKMEQSEHIDEEKLGEVAKALGINMDAIKNFNEEGAVNYINTFNDHSFTNGAFNANHCTFNPIDKIVELYERMLKLEKEKNELLESLLKRE